MAKFKSRVRALSKYTMRTVPATQWSQQGTAMLQLRKVLPKKVIRKKSAAKLAIRSFKASAIKQKQAVALVRKANEADLKKFKIQALLQRQNQARRQRLEAYSMRLREAVQRSGVKRRVNTLQQNALQTKMEEALKKQQYLQKRQSEASRIQLERKLNASQAALNQRIANAKYKKEVETLLLEKKIANAQIAQRRKANAIRQLENKKQTSQTLRSEAQQMAWNTRIARRNALTNRTQLVQNVALQKRMDQADRVKVQYVKRGLLQNKSRLATVGKLNAQSALALQLATTSAGSPQLTQTGLRARAFQPFLQAQSRVANQTVRTGL